VSLTRAMAALHGARRHPRQLHRAGHGLHTDGGIARMTRRLRKARSEGTLLGTEGTGWDIGYGALFLASDESRLDHRHHAADRWRSRTARSPGIAGRQRTGEDMAKRDRREPSIAA